MITITEALAEINLIKKKITDAEMSIRTILVRASHVPDVYQAHGGGAEMVKRTQQATKDLRTRLVTIRGEISRANIDNQLTINKKTMSIFDWLSWKREIYPGLELNLKAQIEDLRGYQKRQAERPEVWKDTEGKTQLVQYQYNVDLKLLEDEYSELVDTYGKLDGQLSLRNATIMIN